MPYDSGFACGSILDSRRLIFGLIKKASFRGFFLFAHKNCYIMIKTNVK